VAIKNTSATLDLLAEAASRPLPYVIHPLDDAPEQKLSGEGLGTMRLSLAARLALGALRAYILLMIVLVGLKAMSLAGWINLG